MKPRIVPKVFGKRHHVWKKTGYPANVTWKFCRKKGPLMQVFWSYHHLPRMSEIFSFCVCVSCFETLQLDLRQKNMTLTSKMYETNQRVFDFVFFPVNTPLFVCTIWMPNLHDVWPLKPNMAKWKITISWTGRYIDSFMVGFPAIVMLVFGGV